jgi:hypothetical protein
LKEGVKMRTVLLVNCVLERLPIAMSFISADLLKNSASLSKTKYYVN